MKPQQSAFALHQYPALIDEALENSINPETGEIVSEEWEKHAVSLFKEMQITALDVACAVKSHEALAEMCRAEEKRLAERRKRHEAAAERYRDAIGAALKPGEKLGDGRAEISWRKSTSVRIDGKPEDLPLRFVRVKTTYDPDKKAIGDALKAGETVPGCILRESHNVQIK